MTPLIGQHVSHYVILEDLGAGGMGVVVKAEDTRLKRIVALKFLPPGLTSDPGAKERFVHEAQAASALQHTNICVVYDIDETPDGQVFISMEYLQGESLQKKVARGPQKIGEAVCIAIQILQGLVAAHEHGIVHRDIKPANIIITPEGVTKIVDFGLAKIAGRTQVTKEGSTVGTAAYMSPEQARGAAADGRADIWAVGVVLYEMLTGRKPFEGEYESAQLYAILNTRPEPITGIRTGVSLELERIVNKAMAKDPADRYQHPDDMLVDLRLAEEKDVQPSSAKSVATSSQPPGRRSFSRVVISAGAILALAVVALLLRPVLFDETLVSEPKPVAVFSFANQTGDHAYDYLQEAIPNLLITSLEQSRHLRVMTWERMRDVLRRMGKQDVAVIDRDLAFDICRTERIHAIVLGSFVKAGDTFATDIKVLDVETKELLTTAGAKGNGVQSILDDQIDDLCTEISRGIGLSGSHAAGAAAQIAEVTTSSMEAYNFYLRGRDEVDKLYYEQAIRFLQKAIALDSSFAIAYMTLSSAYNGLARYSEQAEALRKAERHSARAGEKERLYIQALHARVIERNIAKQRLFYEELASRFPDDKRFHYRLGALYRSDKRMSEAHIQFEAALRLDSDFAPAVIELAYLYADEGNYVRANECLTRYAALSPGDANPFDSIGEIAMRMGQLDRSIAYYDEAVAVKPDFWQSYLAAAYVSALQERYDRTFLYLQGMKEATAQQTVRIFAEYWMAWFRAWLGRPAAAISQWERVFKADTPGKIEEMVNQGDRMLRVFVNFDAGSTDRSRSLLEATFARNIREATFPVSMQVRYLSWVGLMDIQQGRLDSAGLRMARIYSLMPDVEQRTRSECEARLADLKGELLLAVDSADAATTLLRSVPLLPSSGASTASFTLYNIPFMHDALARACTRKGDISGAIEEYRKLLTIDSTDQDRRLIHPRYHLRLAHLLRQTGERQQAIDEYRRFLELWKDAEKDRPELKEAKDGLQALGVRP